MIAECRTLSEFKLLLKSRKYAGRKDSQIELHNIEGKIPENPTSVPTPHPEIRRFLGLSPPIIVIVSVPKVSPKLLESLTCPIPEFWVFMGGFSPENPRYADCPHPRPRSIEKNSQNFGASPKILMLILTFLILTLILYEKKIRSLNVMKIRYHDSNYLRTANSIKSVI